MRSLRSCRVLLSFVLTVAVAAGYAAPVSAAPPKKVLSVEGITEYHLDNGLRVLLFPDPTKPMVTVNMTVLVGSRHEGYGETGMAHLLEHMLFKGTPKFPEFDKLMEARGARNNGSTWYDRTNYFETLPASDDNLEFAIQIEADRLVNCPIKPEDLASEMTVVRSEFESGENDPERVLWQRATAVAYEWHNYGKSTIGNRTDIERVPADRLKRFYEKHYQPDNVILIIAGRFDEPKALGLVEKYFGPLPRPQRKLDATYTEEPAQDGERTVTLRRVGEVGVVAALYHVPAGSHEDYVPVDALHTILSDSPAGVLYKEMVETKKAATVGGFGFPLHDPGYIFVMATVRPDQSLDEARDAMLKALESVVEKGVTEEQVERAKLKFKAARRRELQDTSRLAVELSEWASMGDWRLYFLTRDRYEKVTPQAVHEVAKKYLRTSNRTVATYIPTKQPDRTPVPPPPDLASLLKDYKGREAIAAGEQLDPDPMKIEARVKRPAPIDGIKVALLPKKTRQEMAYLRLTLRYGDENSLKGYNAAAELLPTLMTRGTQKLTRQQIQDELDKLEATLSGGGGTGVAVFSLQAPRPNLPKVLELLRQVLREPSLPESELEILRREELAGLEQQRTEPDALAPLALSRKLFPYPKDDVRYSPTMDESIERMRSVTLEQVKTLYSQFVGSHAGELAMVGDFEPDQTMSLVRPALAGWKSAKPYARIAQKSPQPIPGSVDVIQTPDKANAVYSAGFAMPMDDLHPDYPSMYLVNHTLGGTGAARLFTRVRGKEGLSYGVYSHFNASALDPVAQIQISAIFNPGVVEKVKGTILEEVQKLATGGASETELKEAKDSMLQRRMLNRSQEQSLLGTLSGHLYAGRTMQYEADLEAKVRALTVEQVSSVAKKYLEAGRLVIVTAGDFAPPGAAGAGAAPPAGAGR